MIKWLRQHWKVKNKDLVLILFTFAITGSLTAYLSRKVTQWFYFENYSAAWWASKVIVIFFGYQVIILLIGFCLGQFSFFWSYEKKILRRFGLMKKLQAESHQPQVKCIAIFASGAGSNTQKIIDHFKNSSLAKISLIVCNDPSALVLKIAEKEKIPFLIIERKKFYETAYTDELKKYKIDFIVLAGFLWQLPLVLIQSYPNKIINIHPALLPNFGGKGMYGDKVHATVINTKEKQSGISIHYVDEIYDHGKIIFQEKCNVEENETVESLAKKIHALEHEFYPKIIEQILQMPNHS